MEYIPGVCNIDRVERLKRLSYGITSGFGAVVLMLGAPIAGTTVALEALILFLLTTFFLGVFQYYHKFCVYFGIIGAHSTDKGTVFGRKQAETQRDYSKIAQILIESVIAAIVTWLVYHGILWLVAQYK